MASEDESTGQSPKKRKVTTSSSVVEREADVSGSEEDDEEDEDENEDEDDDKEMRGFIVNDDASDEGEDENEEDDEEMDEGLDEDDLNLIREMDSSNKTNKQSTFRRLKQNKSLFNEGDNETGLFDDEEEASVEDDMDWMTPDDSKSTHHMRVLRQVFGDVKAVFDIIEGKRPRLENTPFEVEEEAKEMDMDQQRDDQDEEGRGGGSKPSSSSGGTLGNASSPDDTSGMKSRMLHSSEEVLGASKSPSVSEQPERLWWRFRYRPYPLPLSIISQEAQWITKRLIYISSNCALPLSCAKKAGGAPQSGATSEEWEFVDLTASPTSSLERYIRPCHISELFDESIQRARYKSVFKLTGAKTAEYDESYYPISHSLETEVTLKVEMVLHMLLNERYEVPLILRQRGHLVCPPLTPEVLWLIYELDLEFWKLKNSRDVVRREITAKCSDSSLLKYVDTVLMSPTIDAHVVADFSALSTNLALHYQVGSKDRPQSANKGHFKKRQSFGTATVSLCRMVLQSEIHKRWSRFFMSTTDYIRNIGQISLQSYKLAFEQAQQQGRGFSSMTLDSDFPFANLKISKECAAPQEPVSQSHQHELEFQRWLSEVTSSVGSENTSAEKTIIVFEGQRLASHPDFRRVVRNWFVSHATITTVTTSKGERTIDATSSNWAAMRLLNKPVDELWKRPAYPCSPALISKVESVDPHQSPFERWGLEIQFLKETNSHREIGLHLQKAEAEGSVEVVISPLSESDAVPWENESGTFELHSRWPKLSSKTTEKEADSQYVKERTALQVMKRKSANDVNLFLEYLTFCWSDSRYSSLWVSFLKQIVTSAVVDTLFPVLRNEIKARLYESSAEYVISLCRIELARKVAVGVFPNPDLKGWLEYAALDDADGGSPEMSNEGGLSCDVLTENEAAELENSGKTQIEEKDTIEVAIAEGSLSVVEDLPLFPQPSVLSIIFESTSTGDRVIAVRVTRQGHIISHKYFNYILLYVECITSDKMDPSSPANRIDTRGVDYVRAAKEAAEFEQIVLCRSTRPNIIVLGVSPNPHFTPFHKYIMRLRNLRLKHKLYKFEVISVPTDIPRIYTFSHLCPPEWKENYGSETLMGLSLARYLQNPLGEVTYLWHEDSGGRLALQDEDVAHIDDATAPGPKESTKNYVLAIHLHQLQSELPRQLLEESLHNTLLRHTNDTGVLVNDVINIPHLLGLLKFVCGLGPKSVKNIRSNLTGSGSVLNAVLHSRKHLLEVENSIHDLVYFNCASFLRIPPIEEDDGFKVDPIEDSRIHPSETAAIAVKMCKDAQEDDHDAVIEVFKSPEKLEDLDLEVYATILNSKGQVRMYTLLEFIKKEIEKPFHDPRCPLADPGPEEMFGHLTSTDLKPGCEVTVRVISTRHATFELLPFQMGASVTDFSEYIDEKLKDLKEQPHGSSADEAVAPPGTIMKCRIDKIEYSKFFVICYSVMNNIKQSLEQCLPALVMYDPTHMSPLIEGDISLACQMRHRALETQEKKQKPKVHLNHPLYISQPAGRIVQIMKRQGKVGQIYFGPPDSSQNGEGIYLFIQTCSNPFRYKIFLIRDRTVENGTEATDLTRELFLGSQKFMSLEHILETYTGPFIAALEEIYAHEKYVADATPEDLEQKLKALAGRGASNNIQWGIALDRALSVSDRAVRFVLMTVQQRACMYGRESKNKDQWVVTKDSLYVNPEGFSLWTRQERSLAKLIQWWKTSGFLKRQKNIEEYTAYKKEKVLLAQQSGRFKQHV